MCVVATIAIFLSWPHALSCLFHNEGNDVLDIWTMLKYVSTRSLSLALSLPSWLLLLTLAREVCCRMRCAFEACADSDP